MRESWVDCVPLRWVSRRFAHLITTFPRNPPGPDCSTVSASTSAPATPVGRRALPWLGGLSRKGPAGSPTARPFLLAVVGVVESLETHEKLVTSSREECRDNEVQQIQLNECRQRLEE